MSDTLADKLGPQTKPERNVDHLPVAHPDRFRFPFNKQRFYGDPGKRCEISDELIEFEGRFKERKGKPLEVDGPFFERTKSGLVELGEDKKPKPMLVPSFSVVADSWKDHYQKRVTNPRTSESKLVSIGGFWGGHYVLNNWDSIFEQMKKIEFMAKTNPSAAEVARQELFYELACAPDNELNKSAEEGTRIHEMFEAIALGQLLPADLPYDTLELEPIVRQWFDEVQPEILFTEAVGFSWGLSEHNHGMAYGCTGDSGIGVKIDGEVTVIGIDVKTRMRGPDGNIRSHALEKPSHPCQTAAMLKCDYMIVERNGEAVRVKPPQAAFTSILSFRPNGWAMSHMGVDEGWQAWTRMYDTYASRRDGQTIARRAVTKMKDPDTNWSVPAIIDTKALGEGRLVLKPLPKDPKVEEAPKLVAAPPAACPPAPPVEHVAALPAMHQTLSGKLNDVPVSVPEPEPFIENTPQEEVQTDLTPEPSTEDLVMTLEEAPAVELDEAVDALKESLGATEVTGYELAQETRTAEQIEQANWDAAVSAMLLGPPARTAPPAYVPDVALCNAYGAQRMALAVGEYPAYMYYAWRLFSVDHPDIPVSGVYPPMPTDSDALWAHVLERIEWGMNNRGPRFQEGLTRVWKDMCPHLPISMDRPADVDVMNIAMAVEFCCITEPILAWPTTLDKALAILATIDLLDAELGISFHPSTDPRFAPKIDDSEPAEGGFIPPPLYAPVEARMKAIADQKSGVPVSIKMAVACWVQQAGDANVQVAPGETQRTWLRTLRLAAFLELAHCGLTEDEAVRALHYFVAGKRNRSLTVGALIAKMDVRELTYLLAAIQANKAGEIVMVEEDGEMVFQEAKKSKKKAA